eukprot:CAMPEP_0118864358 /NCGR_PEP_ID=MMETSP1163-20130328/8961_1 /TAXON_ID=124430 /ORGANISM="Phaeomonas parva, Strain CCMP2877" /LENGTH=359 /DNA_ID=CAMNT_0006798471 /DNA_START=109 /DNA_END=1188 /DNA_ORIENTATION=-
MVFRARTGVAALAALLVVQGASSLSRARVGFRTQRPGTALSATSPTRRDFVHTSAAAFSSLLSLPLLVQPQAVGATVYLDPDRYGDKELKIGTVKSIKQQLRNAILRDPTVASGFLELAILDALSYDADTGKGGLDGSVVLALGAEGADPRLQNALLALLACKKNLQRTKEVTLADLIAFGGGEAIESTGGPVSLVQIGRFDKKADSSALKGIPESPVAAFKRAGLTAREAALLIGAIGEVAMATRGVKGTMALADEEADDEDEPDEGDVIPSSFGAPSEIYGKLVSKNFGNNYMAALKKGSKSSDVNGKWEGYMLGDEELETWVGKYAGNKGGFTKDVAEAYGKLVSMGTEYTTAKQK